MSRRRGLELYRSKSADFGPTLAAEYLVREHGRVVGVETLRAWLVEAGLWQVRRRGRRHRAWRPRRACLGELVQMEGSDHDGFKGRRSRATLMVLIDDATNLTYARLLEEETTAAAMTVFAEYVGRHGLPRGLYVDRASLYETTRDATLDEEVREKAPNTQFGRAMGELEVQLTLAHSPQAKGRVERRHSVFQDRFVKALRLRGIDTLEEANRFLREEFLDELNARFRVEARSRVNLHRRVPRQVRLKQVLCFRETRPIRNDWTLSWRNRVLQIDPRHQRLELPNRTITVSELLDGASRLKWGGHELPERPRPVPLQNLCRQVEPHPGRSPP